VKEKTQPHDSNNSIKLIHIHLETGRATFLMKLVCHLKNDRKEHPPTTMDVTENQTIKQMDKTKAELGPLSVLESKNRDADKKAPCAKLENYNRKCCQW